MGILIISVVRFKAVFSALMECMSTLRLLQDRRINMQGAKIKGIQPSTEKEGIV